MNKHMKLLFSVLFIVIIILAVGITRFYFEVSKNTASINTKSAVKEIIGSDSKGNKIFRNNDDLYGISDSNEHIIVSPQWISLRFADNSRCIASKIIDGKTLFGCIDYEENTIVPFIYSDIKKIKLSDSFIYAAQVSNDNTYIIYDASFKPYFNSPWNSFVHSDNEFTFKQLDDKFIYTFNNNSFTLKSAYVTGKSGNLKFNIDILSRVLLSKADPDKLEYISKCIGAFTSYAFSDDFSFITDCSDNPSQQAFIPFQSDKNQFISANPLKFTNIFIFTTKDTDGNLFFNASASLLVNIYYEQNGSILTAQREFTEKIRFRYDDRSISMISAKFDSINFVPDPPAQPSTQENTNVSLPDTTDADNDTENTDIPSKPQKNISQ